MTAAKEGGYKLTEVLKWIISEIIIRNQIEFMKVCLLTDSRKISED
jgi:hypothetical protein